MTSPWKRRRLFLPSRPWCLPLPSRWALTTRHLYPRHLRSPSGRRGASLALPVTSSRASWSRRGLTIRSQRRASLAPSPPRTVLLRHLPRDLLARGRPRLLIAAVDSQVWPNLDIRAYTLPGSQATQEFNGTSSRTKSFQLRLARLPRPSGPRAFGAEDHAPTDKVKIFPPGGTHRVRRGKGTTRCAAMELPRLARPEGCCDTCRSPLRGVRA